MVAAALWLEFLIRWPNRIPHPIVAVGALIALLERRWNLNPVPDGAKRWRGVWAMLVVVGCAAAAGLAIQLAFEFMMPRVSVYLCAIVGVLGLTAGSLFQHIIAVYQPLARGDLDAARCAVSKVVGRDTASMDATDISAAALESLAESFNDGVVAPVFWFALGGLPALFAYKAINTADSMIGHMDPRWRAFGWAAAKVDDVANWIPARLAGLLIVLTASVRGRFSQALGVMLKDASNHASPNAGWPEAAMAGALDVRLGGPVRYDGVLCQRPVLGKGAAPTAVHLARGLHLYLVALVLLTLSLIGGGALWLV